ncbi:MAG TPA: type II CAAX endopeptidase family protein [Geothrix sp.]|nr:type II CAAX endopeptidase family protein [Geothrix sp.]
MQPEAMSPDLSASWHPDRSWADPLIALLALLALLAAGVSLSVRQSRAGRPLERAGLQGRILEVSLAGPKVLVGRGIPDKDWTRAEVQLKEPWDRALLAVLRAELKAQGKEGKELLGPPSGPGREGFLRVWEAAYGAGPLPDRATRDDVHHRLGGGYAADLLEARLRDREGGGGALRAQARQTLMIRLAELGFLGTAVMLLAVGGLAVGIYLLGTWGKPTPRPLPAWSLSGRAAALILLVWFLAFFLSGHVAALLLWPFPGLRWLAVPLSYLLHAAFGLHLLCSAEGLSYRALWQRVAPGPVGRDLAWGAAFLALAVGMVLTVALVSNLVLKPDQSPQRDLQEMLRSLSGWGPSLALFFTVAGLAPFFEELMFRGFLLPVLARRQRMSLALILSALLFGAIHLQPAGLPTLGTLGWVLGLAMRQTGSLRTPMLVHACWNGSLFLLLRAFA